MRIDGKISGAVFRHSKVEAGISYVENEGVVEISLKSHEDSNSTNTYVLSRACARELATQLQVALTFSPQS